MQDSQSHWKGRVVGSPSTSSMSSIVEVGYIGILGKVWVVVSWEVVRDRTGGLDVRAGFLIDRTTFGPGPC